MQGRVYAPGEAKDEMAQAIKEFNDFVIKDDRVEVVALPFRDGVNIVQRRYSLAFPVQLCTTLRWALRASSLVCKALLPGVPGSVQRL